MFDESRNTPGQQLAHCSERAPGDFPANPSEPTVFESTHVRTEPSSSDPWWAPPRAPSLLAIKPTPMTPAPISSEEDPLLGSIIGSFRISRKLGGGGMGSVYLGEHAVIGSKVAVKFLHDHYCSSDALVQRFLAEARAVNLIGHENIVNIFDMSLLPPRRYFLVMEYLEGKPLSALLGQPLAIPTAVSVLSQVCDALQAAHAHGVTHRDLKPENIFLVRHDRMPHFVKVLDFGIAKLHDSALAGAQTSLGTLMGTPEYMAPEQWYGHTVDGRTDLYALGAIAYALLTGRSAFGKGGVGSLMHSHLMEVPPSPHEVNPEVPLAISEVIMRALAKRPEDRYQGMAELREALEHAVRPPRIVPVEAAPARVTPAPVPLPAPVPAAPVVVAPAPAPVASAPPPTPAPSTPVTLMARVILSPGSAPARLVCTNLSRGGVFLCTEGTLPSLRSILALTLELGERQLSCVAEVVHHVTSAQAQVWKMRPGFAVQFQTLSDEAREALIRVAQGLPPPEASQAAPSAGRPSSQTEAQLDSLLRRRRIEDPYALLAVRSDASFEDIRQRVRTAQRYLDTMASRPLSAAKLQELGELRVRVSKAAEILGQPQQRMEYDAWRSNYAGVARCISAGVCVSFIEELQARFLSEHAGAETVERIHTRTAAAWESQGRFDRALAEYEKALSANPLRLSLQQHYWGLKQRGVKNTVPLEEEDPNQVEVCSPSHL